MLLDKARFSRGQAAIFDGIMFLLFTSISVALVFVFLNGYGISQDDAMRSSYVLAYIQDVSKVLFFVDVSTLRDAANSSTPALNAEAIYLDPGAGITTACSPSNGVGCPYWDLSYGNADDQCSVLNQYFYTTVADLVKRDLSDSDVNTTVIIPGSGGNTGVDPSGLVKLDNYFGVASGVGTPPRAHGKTALRCALKELLKPIQLAGYYYFVEIVNPTPYEHSIPIPGRQITNYWRANPDASGNGGYHSCEDAMNYTTGGYVSGAARREFKILSVSMPFRVPRQETMQDMRNFMLRICIWPGKT